jgi:hypothetical protein
LQEATQSGEHLTPVERIAAESLLKAMKSGTEPSLATLTEEERNKLVTELRTAYRYHLLAFNNHERPDHPGPIDEYVENGIKAMEQDWIKASRS